MTSKILHFDTPTARLRSVAFAEGVSYLVLLLIAMPLKYAAGMPQAVRVVGSLHGALFVWLALLGLLAILQRGKSWAWGVRLAIASLIPFGTFFLDAGLRSDDEAYRAA